MSLKIQIPHHYDIAQAKTDFVMCCFSSSAVLETLAILSELSTHKLVTSARVLFLSVANTLGNSDLGSRVTSSEWPAYLCVVLATPLFQLFFSRL